MYSGTSPIIKSLSVGGAQPLFAIMLVSHILFPLPLSSSGLYLPIAMGLLCCFCVPYVTSYAASTPG